MDENFALFKPRVSPESVFFSLGTDETKSTINAVAKRLKIVISL